MKSIIFLETDGVLQTQKGVEHWLKVKGDIFGDDKFENFCPKGVEFLNKIIENTEAKVVLTSYNREGVHISKMQEVFDKRGVICDIISYTPILNEDSTKGEEIRKWFDVFGTPESYVIIDSDCSDGISDNFPDERYVETSYINGLNDRNTYKKAISSLLKIEKVTSKIPSKKLF
jgi:hypothetical protein